MLSKGQGCITQILSTENALQHLSEADTFFVDGTFSVCPSIFYQIFTIHIMKYNQVFPMIYALLPNKQRHSYNRAYMLLKVVFSIEESGGKATPQCF